MEWSLDHFKLFHLLTLFLISIWLLWKLSVSIKLADAFLFYSTVFRTEESSRRTDSFHFTLSGVSCACLAVDKKQTVAGL